MLLAAFAALTLIVGAPTAPAAVAPTPVPAAAAAATPVWATAPAAGDDVDDDTVPTVPPDDTINEFLPEDRGLSDCLGLVERPGCGSDARGGWRQTLVFVIVMAALAFIAWRIVRSSRLARAARSVPAVRSDEPGT